MIRFAASLVAAAVLAGPIPWGLPPSAQNTCTPDVRVCFNEYASTPGPGGVIIANTDDAFPSFGASAYRRAILIFHLEPGADGRFRPVLVAQAPWCIAVSNCIVKWPTDDSQALSLTLWWGATFDNHNHIIVARVGYPSPAQSN